ncbi:PHA/PHB synthase family protein [Albidovulum sediminicola]|uniref:Class I poly(R)-hydroxyalkanoic acid synthase n=1 Tax=Albidovulum sediminicola TaxID=2984331 RepID=A0ABT2Z4Q0_9RHOB|nr:class I poly(R)-hydroxyalkanoic acid synthase [Defluviimonas sp. WL0075]MCV2865972.1 class I poly(R)-hydroxyalkanoic acid synthase [Defluviimonas sp. WL0075]
MAETDKETGALDIAETGARLLTLTQRMMSAAAQAQAHSVRTATGSEFSLMDAATLAKAYGAVWADALSNPAEFWETQIKAGTNMMNMWQSLLAPEDEAAGAKPKDRRFADPAWSEDPMSRVYRDVFLTFEKATKELLDGLPKESKDHLRVSFYTRQMLSALSPSNYLLTNAAARKKFIETKGESLLNGLENLLVDLERGEGRVDLATNDPTAFEVGVNLATTEGKVVFENELMQLIQYEPRTEKQHAIPLLLVPAWINKFYILDMRPENSLVRYMLDRGHSVFVISWVNPTKAHADKDFADYMKLGPLTALDVMRDITQEEKANILGFCIGGILVTATLGYLAATGDQRINAATTLATMVDFNDVGEIGVFIDDNRLKVLREHMKDKGYLENRHLQDMFSMLREKDLIWSFVEASYLRGDKPRAFDLLFWNSDSTRLPAAMLLWYLEEVYLQNKLRTPGGLEMNGVRIDISKIKTPFFILATEDDHIAPWTSIYPATQILGGEVEFVLGGSGHIAGVINPPAKRPKYGFRTAAKYPPTTEGFLEAAVAHEGSWWPHWAEWLEAKDGRMVAPRKPATRGRYKAIEPAPGRYVKAK